MYSTLLLTELKTMEKENYQLLTFSMRLKGTLITQVQESKGHINESLASIGLLHR